MRDYEQALAWVLRERAGGGGHPPRDVHHVIGWKITRLLAHLYEVPLPKVAGDLIDMHLWMEKHEHHEADQ